MLDLILMMQIIYLCRNSRKHPRLKESRGRKASKIEGIKRNESINHLEIQNQSEIDLNGKEAIERSC